MCVFAASTLRVGAYCGAGREKGQREKGEDPVTVLWKIPFHQNVEREKFLPVLGITVCLSEIIKGYKYVYVHNAYLMCFVVG